MPSWSEDFEGGSAGSAVTPENSGFNDPEWDEIGESAVFSSTHAHSGFLSLGTIPSDEEAAYAAVQHVVGNLPLPVTASGWFRTVGPAPGGDQLVYSSVAAAMTSGDLAKNYGSVVNYRADGRYVIINLAPGMYEESAPIAAPQDQWLQFEATFPEGAIAARIKDASGSILGEHVTQGPAGQDGPFLLACQGQAFDGGPSWGHQCFVDDLLIEWGGVKPVTRLYPRTDGRGLSSAPRHVGRVPNNRFIGGHP